MERLELSPSYALPCHDGEVGMVFGQKQLLKEFLNEMSVAIHLYHSH